MRIYYHLKDLDGICSGAIMKYKYPNIKLIGYDYGQDFDIDQIEENEEVFMADISLPMDKMKEISDKTGGNFTWIDHHKSAINDFNNYPEFKINTVLQQGKGACELTWETLFHNTDTPYIVQLLSAYDVWDHKRFDWNKDILPIQYGVRLDCKNDVNKFNHNLFNNHDYFEVIYKSGVTILEYQLSENKRYANLHAFEEEFQGYKAICINGIGSSALFDSVIKPEHELMVLFTFMVDHWTFTLYTNKEYVDCSIIAKMYGGGGHKSAAGFQLPRQLNPFFD